jgi:hypothetical protein
MLDALAYNFVYHHEDLTIDFHTFILKGCIQKNNYNSFRTLRILINIR